MTHLLESKFFGKALTQRPTCPFCGQMVERPVELETRRPGEMPVGSCACGAVYACDETGHNVGAAIVEALVFACNMDWDLAWNLLPEEDYRQELVEDYDFVTHRIVPGRVLEGRRTAGVLVFVRPHEDVLEVTGEGVRKRLKKAQPKVSQAHTASDDTDSSKPAADPVLSKSRIEELVRAYDYGPIVAGAATDKRILRKLQRLLYSGDALFRNRAAEILGRVCAALGERDPAAVSKLLGSLFYAITDTAAFTWGAFEAIGEIIGRRPDLFGGYTAQLYQFLPDATRRAPTIRALGRIAEVRPDLLRKHTFHFLSFLQDPDPEVRGYTAWLLGNLGAREAREDLERLSRETPSVNLYAEGRMWEKAVGEIAAEACRSL
jgi:hypothetical protein